MLGLFLQFLLSDVEFIDDEDWDDGLFFIRELRLEGGNDENLISFCYLRV